MNIAENWPEDDPDDVSTRFFKIKKIKYLNCIITLRDIAINDQSLGSTVQCTISKWSRPNLYLFFVKERDLEPIVF